MTNGDFDSRLRQIESRVDFVEHLLFGSDKTATPSLAEEFRDMTEEMRLIRKGHSQQMFVITALAIISVLTMLTVSFAFLLQ